MKFWPHTYGFNRHSDIDGWTFAPTLFMGGCNLNCPYCMNVDILFHEAETTSTWDLIQQLRSEGCEKICISGGEPTINLGIRSFLKELRGMGFKLHMSTNGVHTSTLNECLPYLDHVSLDIKSYRESVYEDISGMKDAFDHVVISKKILDEKSHENDRFDFEIRTTVFPPFVKESDLRNIGKEMMNKGDHWILQQFRHTKKMLQSVCKYIAPYTDYELAEFGKICSEYVDDVSVRCV